RRGKVRVEAVRLAVLVEVRQLATRPVVPPGRRLVALLPGDRVELGRVLLEGLVGLLRLLLGLGPAGAGLGDLRRVARIALRRGRSLSPDRSDRFRLRRG